MLSRLNTQWQLMLIFSAVFTIAFAVFGYLAYNEFSEYARDLARRKLQSDTDSLTDRAVLLIQGEDIEAMAQDTPEGAALRAEYATLLSNLNVLGGEEDGVEREFIISLLLPDTQEVQTLLYITADPANNDLALYIDPADDETWAGWVFASQEPAQYEIYEEKGKFWAQSSAPIVDGSRAPVGAVLDVFVSADNQISAVNSRLQRSILTAALIAFPLMLAAVFLVAFTVTRALQRLMNAAQALDQGEAYQAEWLAPVMKRQDEFGKLAKVFDHMAVEVQGREAKLKNEIIKLKIEIDYGKQKQQVEEITGSDYFQDLKNKSAEMRAGKGGAKPGTGELTPERASSGPVTDSIIDEDDYMAKLKNRADKMRPPIAKTELPSPDKNDSPEA